MNESPVLVSVEQLRQEYPAHGGGINVAVEDVSFQVHAGSVVAIVGPSGAGKTTVLRSIAGLLRPTSGQVVFEGAKVTGPPADAAFVFQDYSRSLLPWMSAESNIMLPLRAKGVSKVEARSRAQEALDAVGLSGRGKVYPRQLSGGMQQRVAIARALAYRPALLLMDEPFASVDAQTRMDLEDLVLPLRDQFDVTIIFVTHDIDEAVYLSDHVVVLSSPPSRVAEVVTVDLATPRTQTGTKADPDFARLRSDILAMVRRTPADD